MSTYAWGSNPKGLLGVGNVNVGGTVTTPTLVIGDFVEASSDGATTLFRTSDGRVFYAGDNATGAAGSGSNDFAIHHTPTQIPFTNPVTKIATGTGGLNSSPSYYALDNTGQLFAWGADGKGEWGIGVSFTFIPTLIATGVLDFISGASTVILKPGGVVQAAGWNADGELGDGTTTDRSSWTTVTPASGTVVAIAYGMQSGGFTLLRMADGSVLGVGDSESGQLGYGVSGAIHTTRLVLLGSNVTEVWANQGGTFCRLVSGAIEVFGYAQGGRLGTGAFSDFGCVCTNNAGASPAFWNTTYIPGGVTMTQFAHHPTMVGGAAVGSDGKVYTWALPPGGTKPYTDNGQGNPTYPISVNGLAGMTWVGAGGGTAFGGTGQVFAGGVTKSRSWAQVIG